MKKFAFVILHYNTIEDTHACVASIRKNVREAICHIIIVDNCSPNKTGLILKEEYSTNEDVTVLLNHENLGFAKGNNVGFKYAKEILNADFIILLNSDTELLEDIFVQLVEHEYEKSHFAALGPLIKKNSYPYIVKHERETIISPGECVVFIIRLSLYYLLSFFNLDLLFRRLFRKSPKEASGQAIKPERLENVQLSGCFLIFSRDFINRFDGLNPNTFLYKEEELLFIRIRKSGLKTVYQPSIETLHKGESSTSSVLCSNIRRRRFGYKERIKSTFVILKTLYTKKY